MLESLTKAIAMLFALLLIILPQINAIQTIKQRRTVIITGANSGVGFSATKQLAATNDWKIIMACRDLIKANKAKEQISVGKENLEIMELDLADLKSIAKFKQNLGDEPVDCLVCNAGVQESTSGLGGKEADAVALRTKQGFELTVGTNHIGHFALLKLLRGNVERSRTGGRIVIVSSGVHDPQSPGGCVQLLSLPFVSIPLYMLLVIGSPSSTTTHCTSLIVIAASCAWSQESGLEGVAG